MIFLQFFMQFHTSSPIPFNQDFDPRDPQKMLIEKVLESLYWVCNNVRHKLCMANMCAAWLSLVLGLFGITSEKKNITKTNFTYIVGINVKTCIMKIFQVQTDRYAP